MTLTPRSIRVDAKGRPCGQSHIPATHTCHQKGAFPTKAAIATGLGAAALVGAGLYAARARGRRTPTAGPTVNPGPPLLSPGSIRRALPGSSPYGLLPPGPPRQSKTARMRANTATAARTAEQRITQTAQEEVRRIAQIGNTMAAAGEATGMAAKTGFREFRLRVEAARRRYEPGYRKAPAKPPEIAKLPTSSAQIFATGVTPVQPLTPATVDPRTGQPRRRKPRGFG